MRTIRRPSRAQVARAMRAWRTFAAPPERGKTNPLELAGGEGAEGTTQGERSEDAGRHLSILSGSEP